MEVRAQDDFDNHVNMKWKNDNPIPEKYPRYTNFTVLSEMMEDIMKDMSKDKDNTIINKIHDLYLNQTDSQFKQHVSDIISKFNAAQSPSELIDMILSEIPNWKLLSITYLFFSYM